MARLTWWEYSWDVIEPCTYFVNYVGAILCYTFYLSTKTPPGYQLVSKCGYLSRIICVSKINKWHNYIGSFQASSELGPGSGRKILNSGLGYLSAPGSSLSENI